MKYVKSYNIFTSLSHRLVLHLCVPAFGMLLSLAALLTLKGPSAGTELNVAVFGMVFSSVFLATYGAAMDGKVFGGSMRKGESRIDYLKCSVRGMQVFRDALIGDQILRLLTHLLVVGLCALLSLILSGRSAPVVLVEWLLFSSGSWVVSQAGIFTGRMLKFESQIATFAAMFLSWGLAFSVVMVSDAEGLRAQCALPLAFLCFFAGTLLAVLMVRRSVRKKGEEYYDD